MDRDGKFSRAFQAILKTEGVNAVLLPAKSPNLNAHLERFHRSLKEECLERMIFFGEASLRNAVREFLAHYHGERNHQGMAKSDPRPR
jgi:transposase InsO family protein